MAEIERATQPSYGGAEPPLSEKGKAVRHLVEANLLDDRYATTKRGLKNRHVQLMALGGTIGTGKYSIMYPTTGD
jgi:amino acid transporter